MVILIFRSHCLLKLIFISFVDLFQFKKKLLFFLWIFRVWGDHAQHRRPLSPLRGGWPSATRMYMWVTHACPCVPEGLPRLLGGRCCSDNYSESGDPMSPACPPWATASFWCAHALFILDLFWPVLFYFSLFIRAFSNLSLCSLSFGFTFQSQNLSFSNPFSINLVPIKKKVKGQKTQSQGYIPTCHCDRGRKILFLHLSSSLRWTMCLSLNHRRLIHREWMAMCVNMIIFSKSITLKVLWHQERGISRSCQTILRQHDNYQLRQPYYQLPFLENQSYSILSSSVRF